MIRGRTVTGDARQIELSTHLIKLGARLQVLESETNLSRERLLRLYKEVQGKSPPKGMLPFSTDWFLTWQPNIHASLFIGIYRYLSKQSEHDRIEVLVRAYRLYLEHIHAFKLEQVLSLTRAWILIRYFDGGVLRTTDCKKCSGHFVVHSQDLYEHFLCGLCNVPSRAGKTGPKKKLLDQLCND
ncbi:MAG: flagellar transcriptional regulator FlhC [Pseudomonadota bacterium]